MSGVGISFGADRIYDVMAGLNLFPEDVDTATRVLFLNMGAEEEVAALEAIAKVRGAGISAEIYPEAGKMKKQMEYADRRHVPYVAIIGSNELAAGKVTLKNMRTGMQTEVEADLLAEYVR